MANVRRLNPSSKDTAALLPVELLDPEKGNAAEAKTGGVSSVVFLLQFSL